LGIGISASLPVAISKASVLSRSGDCAHADRIAGNYIDSHDTEFIHLPDKAPVRASRGGNARPLRRNDRHDAECEQGGLYFEMESTVDVGSEVSFDVEMNTPLGGMKLKGSGQVLRKEQKGSRTGIAVKGIESRLETIG